MFSLMVILFWAVLVSSQNTDIETSQRDSTDQCSYTFIVPRKDTTIDSSLNRSDNELSDRLAILEHNLHQIQAVMNIPSTQYSNYPIIFPQDCHHAYILNSSSLIEGVYLIQPEDYPEPFAVYCQVTDTGVWTVIQRRQDDTVEFYNEWQAYKWGFGQLTGNHWLGNEKIFYILRSGVYKLRVDLGDWAGDTTYAEYDFMQIGNEESKYTLSIGEYSGTAGHSMTHDNGMKFSTKDEDNDLGSGCCACDSYGQGAWWYRECTYANLNGPYINYNGNIVRRHKSIHWHHWHGLYPLKNTTMKVQRVHPYWE
ncbi:fibrinogen-like protein A [Saccoglossus kowalevskii]